MGKTTNPGRNAKPKRPSLISQVVACLKKLESQYEVGTSPRLKIIDCYLLFVCITALIQLLYCFLVGTFPFNSFLGGFISSVGSFVIGMSLRIHVNPQNSEDFSCKSRESAFGEFLFCHIILHLAVVNFLG